MIVFVISSEYGAEEIGDFAIIKDPSHLIIAEDNSISFIQVRHLEFVTRLTDWSPISPENIVACRRANPVEIAKLRCEERV